MQTILEDTNSFDCPENTLHDLIAEIKSTEDKAFPLRKMSKKKAKKIRTPWMLDDEWNSQIY